VLFPETEFSKSSDIPVQGIVETGVNRLLYELNRSPRSIVAIFGTVTTIDENTYSNLLGQRGVDQTRIVSQACPSLADTISEDRQGLKAQKKIEKYVDSAIANSKHKFNDYLVHLACTHYGYRKNMFSTTFEKHGFNTMVLNPNEFVIEDLFKIFDNKSNNIELPNDVSVEFITRYKIPETALETITFFLDGISPKTVRAFTNYTHSPDLF